MKIKDYLGFFTSLVGDEIDYIIHFKYEKPEMSKYPNLLKLGNWNNYGDKGYRLVCKIGKEDLLELISIETGIDKSKIEIAIPANNVWIK
ncbi:hypothetical protein [Clostridium thermobutyricum]|uniref:hypothetical protein n=1 Tax=Clostridium thermobutyricum TaxID=29372 RepID=UPI003F520070